jgi:L-ribulokinase
MKQYTIGLDYGTNSVRALIVNLEDGREVGTAVWN